MTARYSPTIRCEDGEIISTGLKPAASPSEFASACRAIVRQREGHEAHRLLDRLVTDLLSSLGYSEGMEIFLAKVTPFHSGEPE